MRAVRTIPRDVTDERFRVAVALGIVSIPISIAVNWLSFPTPVTSPAMGHSFEGTILLVACLLAGYLYGSRLMASIRAGVITGVVGGSPLVVWAMAATFVVWWPHLGTVNFVTGPMTRAALTVAATGLVGVVGAAVILVIGYVGGRVGGWANDRVASARALESGS